MSGTGTSAGAGGDIAGLGGTAAVAGGEGGAAESSGTGGTAPQGGMSGGPTCGNGKIDGNDGCDDGNTTAGDGCSPTCQVETGWTCDANTCTEICGDGLTVGKEAKAGGCDDKNTVANDGCTHCTVDPGYVCSGAPSKCAKTCGNGMLDPNEACDDGNMLSGDGCFACAIEPGYTCDTTGQPTTCADVNECATNNGGCDANANCTNTPGSRTCTCKTGFVGNGTSCTKDCGSQTLCNDSCVNVATDTSNCLSCGTKCSAPAANGKAVCTSSGCDISCNDSRCGSTCCDATPSGATAGCSANTCTFTCNSNNHGCGGSVPPCYANTDGAHCGSSCFDCSNYVGTTGTCSSSQCACEASSTLACAAGVPTCGSWDFNSSTVENWRFGSYFDATHHHWVGSLGTQVTNGSPALSAKYDGTAAGSGVAEFAVDLCPNGAILNLSSYVLGFDFYFLTTGGTPFSQDPNDSTFSFLADGSKVITSCQPFVEPGSDQWIHGQCANLPPSLANLTIIFQLDVGWAGQIFLDNVTFTPM